MRRIAGFIGGLLLLGILVVLFTQAVWAPIQPAPTPIVHAPTPEPSAATATASPAPASPTVAPQLDVWATAGEETITFGLGGSVPVGAVEALLWYDSEAGYTLRRVPLDATVSVSTSVTITPTGGLTVSVPQDLDQLDYWWAVRDRGGAIAQRSGVLDLPPSLTKRPLPPQVPAGFAWREHRSPHFLFRFAPSSAAERDIAQIERIAEEGYVQASAVISPALIGGAHTAAPTFTVYLVPRVFWQGGVAYSGGTLMISYLDRNYADVAPWSYFVHETTHALARAYAQEGVNIGGLLGEGIAVYATGGHYSLEPLRERAAGLLELNMAADLCRLTVDFYGLQHEAAYLQAASYVDYLIERFGLVAFLEHYLSGHMPELRRNESEEAFCAELRETTAEPFGVSYGEIEQDWLDWLRETKAPPTVTQVLSMTIRYYDLMRRYETERDPAARLLPPDPAEGWPSDILAQFLTQAITPTNVLQELMLIAGHQALHGDLDRSTELLDAVERSLDTGHLEGALSADYSAAQELFDGLARARRLGRPEDYAAHLTPGAVDESPPPALYSRYRMTLQQLAFDGDVGRGLVRINSQPVGGDLDWRLYAFELVRENGRWLLGRLTPAHVILAGPPGPQAILGQ